MFNSFFQKGLDAIPAIILFLFILTVLVLIHELGHFLMARRFGIKVEEFGFGFPPRVWGKKRGETLYSINALPIGGFVKLYGEDEAGMGKVQTKSEKITKDLNRAFFSKPIWQRVLVVVAGVAMNFALAVGIIAYIYTFYGFPSGGEKIVVTEVVKNSPADSAGLKKGDQVLLINNNQINSADALISTTRANLGKEISILVDRNGSQESVKVTPRKEYPANQGPMGIAVGQNTVIQKYPFPQSLYYGFTKAVNDSALVVVGFKDVVVSIVVKFTIPEGVAGPIGMAQLTKEASELGGAYAILNLMYMLSLSLAVLNILPIPALDGGRLFFILIEAVTRRKVDPKYETYAHVAGLIVLLSFLAFISVKDILRIVAGQSIIPQ